MSNPWHKSETDDEAAKNADEFLAKIRSDLQTGNFWADRIKQYRGEPVKRLQIALENLPLPAAFREGAIAVRALIREKRSNSKNYDDELSLLYWLAAIESFSIPYSEALKEPGINVLETIPGKLLKGLPFTYAELGYTELKLLNKTDIKWLSERWGEPRQHTSLHKMHGNVWREYEGKLLLRRKSEGDEIFNRLRNEVPSSSPVKSPEKLSWHVYVIAFLVVVFLLYSLVP